MLAGRLHFHEGDLAFRKEKQTVRDAGHTGRCEFQGEASHMNHGLHELALEGFFTHSDSSH